MEESSNIGIRDCLDYLTTCDKGSFVTKLTFEFIDGNITSTMLVGEIESRIRPLLNKSGITDIQIVTQVVIKLAENFIGSAIEFNSLMCECEGDGDKMIDKMKLDFNLLDEEINKFRNECKELNNESI